MRVSFVQNKVYGKSYSAQNEKQSVGVAFGGHTQNIKKAAMVLKSFAAEKIQSPKYREIIDAPRMKFRTNKQEQIFHKRNLINEKKLEFIRDVVYLTPFKSLDEKIQFLEKIVLRQKIADSSEMAAILNSWMEKAGLKSFHGVIPSKDYGPNHGIVVVSENPILNTVVSFEKLNNTPHTFVVDPSLNKLFKTIPKAMDCYSKFLNIEPNDVVVNATDLLRKSIANYLNS